MDNTTLIRAANGARIAEAITNYGRTEIEASPSTPPDAGEFLLHNGDGPFWESERIAAVVDGIRNLHPELVTN